MLKCNNSFVFQLMSAILVPNDSLSEYVGLQHVVPPTNTKFKPLLLRTQMGVPYTNTYKHRTLYFKSTLTFLGPAKLWKCLSADPTKTGNSCVFIIRSCCSILYVGLQHAVPPTNTKIKPLLLLTQAGT